MGAGTSHLETKSVVISEGSGVNGAIRRHKDFAAALKGSAFESVRTCRDAFLRGLAQSKDRPCFGYRSKIGSLEVSDPKDPSVAPRSEAIFGDFEWMTYAQVAAKVDAVGSAIAHFGLAKPNDLGDRCVGIYGKNRWEWSTAQHALFRQGAVSVPLYDTLGESAVAYIIQQTGMTTIFCSKAETGKLVGWKHQAAFKSLKNIVQFEVPSAEDKAKALAAGLTLRGWAECEAAGTANPKEAAPPAPASLAVICYTSGTTGNPKGVRLTHANMVADAGNAFTARLIDANDNTHVYLSYLPLAHVFEQLVQNALVMVGASIGFYQGDTLKIMDDIKALRPTLFVSVPRLFNRIYDGIHAKVAAAGGVKAKLFHLALDVKKFYLSTKNITVHPIFDTLVFNNIKASAGLDRCRLMLSGSAPLPAHVMEFLRCVFCPTVEGYGSTEMGGACSATDPDDQASLGHVGGPLPSNEIKLVSVPDLGYNVTDTIHGREVDKEGKVVKEGVPCFGRGEVCVRGPNVFSGYYKDPVNTKEAIDADGWLHSGDIGIWDARGQIKIVDRKKNMFKLSQGEYVAAEKVEAAVLNKYVGQIFIYGDSFHSMLLAIVVPNPDAVKVWARENGKVDGAGAPAKLEALGNDEGLKKAILAELQAQGKARGLQGFEIPKGIHLDPVAWTPDDLLTPSFKLKRADAKKKYAAEIEALYGKLETVAGKAGLKQA